MQRAGKGRRVEWEIEGETVWFECEDLPLRDSGDAFACLCFATSALDNWKLRFPLRICPVLSAHLKKLWQIWDSWWSIGPTVFKTKCRNLDSEETSKRGTAVFLSLGVDSFYTMLHRSDVGSIIYVCGYDVRLQKADRLKSLEKSLRDVANRSGVKLVVVRTNLRDHSILRKINWEKFHGAALATVGHLLAAEFSKILISASFSVDNFKPWGSSWKTDYLWSSKQLQVEHFGQDLWRVEKLEKIVNEPLVIDHLRICWEHRNDEVNCGECEKCLRTMLGLLSLGKLDEYPTFPDVDGLVSGLDRARLLPEFLIPTYQSFLNKDLPPKVVRPLEKLVRKSNVHIAKKQANIKET